jgi:hypothetical protein
MKFSSSIIAAAEQKPATDQRVFGFNVTDQGYHARFAAAWPRWGRQEHEAR